LRKEIDDEKAPGEIRRMYHRHSGSNPPAYDLLTSDWSALTLSSIEKREDLHEKEEENGHVVGYARPVDPTRTTPTGKKQLDEEWEA
jgi:hypothetical protein